MIQYTINITDVALADMASIYKYIATVFQMPDTAMKQYNRIAEGIESLATFPERYMRFTSQPERDLGMRQLLVDNYSVVYVVGKREVTVVRVLYSASDIQSQLREN